MAPVLVLAVLGAGDARLAGLVSAVATAGTGPVHRRLLQLRVLGPSVSRRRPRAATGHPQLLTVLAGPTATKRAARGDAAEAESGEPVPANHVVSSKAVLAVGPRLLKAALRVVTVLRVPTAGLGQDALPASHHPEGHPPGPRPPAAAVPARHPVPVVLAPVQVAVTLGSTIVVDAVVLVPSRQVKPVVLALKVAGSVPRRTALSSLPVSSLLG